MLESLTSSAAKMPQALSLYSNFITKNATAVSQIESGLRSLTYIIPGQFRESALASESLHSGIGLLSLYHDSLLSRAAAAQRPNHASLKHQTPHTRYTRFWTAKSPTYRRIATLLQMVQYTELLWEMAAKRKGETLRWRVVVLLECVKAVCRLLLLRLTNSRPLLSPPLPARIDPATLDEHNREPGTDGLESPPSERSADNDAKWTMPRTGLSLPSLPESQDISSYLLSKVLTADDIKPPKNLLHPVTGAAELAEWLYILRPVIYALAMQRWGARDKAAWRPWLVGFSLEYGARQLAKRDFRTRISGGLRGLTGLEKEELKKRGWALAWWAMRGAFYENVTKAWVQGLAGRLAGKPLIGLLGTIVEDYDFLWDQYYFPTATL